MATVNIIHLTAMAEQSQKVRLFDTYQASVAKFYNGSVRTVELSEAEYDELAAWIKRQNWKIVPNVTSGGFTAQRVTQ